MPPKTKAAALTIDVRDRRLAGGRIKVSARTSSKTVFRRRESAVRALLDQGEIGVLDRLRSREIGIEEVQRAVEKGDVTKLRPLSAEQSTIEQEANAYLVTARATVRPSTVSIHRAILDALKRDMGGSRLLADVTEPQAEAWIHAPKPPRSKGGTAKPWGATRQRQAAMLCGAIWTRAIRRAMDESERTGLRPSLTRNPWKSVKLPKKAASRKAFLAPAQWRSLRQVTEGTPRAALYAACCLAGLRLGEALMLRVGVDVEFPSNGRRGRIRVQPREGEGAWLPKTDRSIRDIPMSAELVRILRAHIDAGFAGSTYLIRRRDTDRPVRLQAVSSWAERDFALAGLRYGLRGDGLTMHSLRHTFASWLVQADVQLMKVAMLLGDTVAMVEAVYGHLVPKDLERAVDLLDAKAESVEEAEEHEDEALSTEAHTER